MDGMTVLLALALPAYVWGFWLRTYSGGRPRILVWLPEVAAATALFVVVAYLVAGTRWAFALHEPEDRDALQAQLQYFNLFAQVAGCLAQGAALLVLLVQTVKARDRKQRERGAAGG
jgi:hypothetical protein